MVDRHVRVTVCALAVVHRPWPVEVRCLDLAEEVGEFARAVLVDVFALADHYDVKLDELYVHLLARLVSGHPGEAGGAGNGPEAGWEGRTAMMRPATDQQQVCDCGSCGPRNDDRATTGRGSRGSRADVAAEPPTSGAAPAEPPLIWSRR